MPFQNKKMGVFWVNIYTQKPPLSDAGTCADGFYNTLQGQKTIRRGDFGALNKRAFDIHFQQPPVITSLQQDPFPPGNDINWAEKVDMLYFCGHGDAGNLYLGAPAPNVLYSSESAYYDYIKWGDGRIKWAVLDACEVLENKQLNNGSYTIFNRWAKVFRKGGTLRYLFGFHTTCKIDANRGLKLANKLNPPGSGINTGEIMHIAWRYAVEQTDTNAEWAYLRAGGVGSPLRDDRWTDDPPVNDPQISAQSNTQQFVYLKKLSPQSATIDIIN